MSVIGLASIASAAWSPTIQTGNESVSLSKDTIHKGSFYATGSQVTIDGRITGSLYCAGGTVTVNGTVEGDVLCAAQKIVINGTVEQDARVAGQFVEIEGSIEGSLSALAQDVRVAKESSIKDDMNGLAQQVTMNGIVGRDVVMGVQLMSLNGEVKGDIDLTTNQIQLGNEATVTGNFNYTSQKELSIDEAKIQGSVSYNPQQHDQKAKSSQLLTGTTFLLVIMFAVSAMIIALLIPRFLQRSSDLLPQQILQTALVGFAFVFGGPILVASLILSIVLAPIGVALLFGWFAILLLSGIFFAYWVGSELLRSQKNVLIRMAGGSAVVMVFYLIPFINALMLFAAVVIGSGMIVATLTNGYKRPNYTVTSGRGKVSS